MGWILNLSCYRYKIPNGINYLLITNIYIKLSRRDYILVEVIHNLYNPVGIKYR